MVYIFTRTVHTIFGYMCWAVVITLSLLNIIFASEILSKEKLLGVEILWCYFILPKKKPPMHLVNRKVQITVKCLQDRNFVFLMILRSNYIILWLTLKSTNLLYRIHNYLRLLCNLFWDSNISILTFHFNWNRNNVFFVQL